jgi:hypothetical protein
MVAPRTIVPVEVKVEVLKPRISMLFISATKTALLGPGVATRKPSVPRSTVVRHGGAWSAGGGSWGWGRAWPRWAQARKRNTERRFD